MSRKDANGLGQQPIQRMGVVTVEQAKHLLSTARGHPLEALVTVALTTGLRRGELLGLRWQQDVDMENELLHVCRTISPIGKIEASETARTIALPKVVLSALKRQRIRQEESCAQAGEMWHDLGLVFPNEHGHYIEPASLWKQSHALFVSAGLPHMHFHDLRRSTVALLIAMGANGHVVQTILGSHWMSTTLKTLAPASLAMQRDVMQKWDDLLLSDNREEHTNA